MSATPKPSVVDDVKRRLDLIRRLDPEIKAWEYLDENEAIQRATFAETHLKDAPLYGAVVGVKDIFETFDMPTAYGSTGAPAVRREKDAVVVGQLRRYGAVLLGKTVSTEFASWPPSRTRNPRELSHSPGGSSAGSAAAVAAGMVTSALGTQTLGSIIRPASYCGVVGFKPSFGRISRLGVHPGAPSLDTVGVLTSTVREAALLYRVLAEDEDVDVDGRANRFAGRGGKPAFAFCPGPCWEFASRDSQDAMLAYVEALRANGVAVEHFALPPEFDALPKAGKRIHDFEMRQTFSNELASGTVLSPTFRAGFDRLERVSLPDYERALVHVEACRRALPDVMGRFDALITPAATGEAPAGLETTGSPVMNTLWTALHAPCLTLPKLKGATGLPIGVQIVAPRFRDAALLAAARVLDGVAPSGESGETSR